MWFSERGIRVSRSFWLLVLLAAVVSPLSVVLSVLLAAALHECGHLLALRAFHVPVEGLHLSAFGAVIHARGARRLSYGRELIVTLAGCGMNLVCGFLTALFALQVSWENGFVLAGAHLLLCAFNSAARRRACALPCGFFVVRPNCRRQDGGAGGSDRFACTAGRCAVLLRVPARGRAVPFCLTCPVYPRRFATEACETGHKSVE